MRLYTRIRLQGFAVAVSASALIAPLESAATAQRTFVSVGGSDANACSVAAPCRSFDAAIAQTLADGEVIVVDSGGYGPMSITQSVSIIAPAGVYAGVTAFSSAAVNIAGTSPTVVLRGLTLNGLGGFVGIQIQNPVGANVVIERSVIRGFTYGLFAWGANLRLVIRDTELSQNDYGMNLLNGTHALLERVIVRHSLHSGIALRSLFPAAGNAIRVEIRDSAILTNETGIVSDSTQDAGNRDLLLVVDRTQIAGSSGGDAIFVNTMGASTSKVTVTGSTIVDNIGAGVHVFCTTPGGTTNAVVTDSTITDHGSAAIIAGGSTCKASAGRNMLARNNVGLYNINASGFVSFGNNQLVDNVLPTFGAITTLSPQ